MRKLGVFRLLGLVVSLLMCAFVTPRAFARPLCTVTIASPSDGQALVTPVNITITGTIVCDPVDGVMISDNGAGLFYIDVSQMSGSGFSYSFSKVWTNVPLGTHYLTASSTTESATSDAIVVTVLPPATGSLSASPNPCNIP